MHTKKLREVAKFASGLVMGDFIFGLWLYFSGMSATFLGITFADRGILAWIIFDAVLFAFLVHYGWKRDENVRTSREKVFHLLAGILFGLVALLHLSRIAFGWSFEIGTWQVPYWLNGIGTVITAFLAYASFHLASRRR